MTDVAYLREQVRELQDEIEMQRDVIAELRNEISTTTREIIVMEQALRQGKMEYMLP
jgi:peptidoglycan hydrolase CwlO-like protein